jgi:hypothetical protein
VLLIVPAKYSFDILPPFFFKNSPSPTPLQQQEQQRSQTLRLLVAAPDCSEALDLDEGYLMEYLCSA